MRHFFATLLFLLFSVCMLQATDLRTATFSRLNTADGLSDNQVQHILQLPDGRMVFTTRGNINLYDGWQFRYIHRHDEAVYRLEDYTGAYHVYIGKDDWLWVKNWKSLWCLDLKHERYIHHPEQQFSAMGLTDKVTDLFVDGTKTLWLVTKKGVWDTTRKRYLNLPQNQKSPVLLDVVRQTQFLYLFYNSGEVACYDLSKDRIIYRSAAYPKKEQSHYGYTSLVVEGPDKRLYQVCNGTQGGVFMFDPQTHKWHCLMTTPYILHTLIVPTVDQAYVTCGKGLWNIQLKTGQTSYYPSLLMSNGDFLTTNINTIFQDNRQGIWLGTSNQGLLYTHNYRFKFHSASTPEKLGLASQTIDSLLRLDRPVRWNNMTYTTLFKDSRQRLWAGTPDGLRLFIPGDSCTYIYYTENGLSNNFIHGITEDHSHDIWVSTSNGISRINTNDIPHHITSTNYKWTNGTLKGEYLDGMAFTLPDKRILMKGVEGWTLFHPDSVYFPLEHFKPILIDIALHGKSLAIGQDTLCNKVLLPEQAPYVSDFELDWQNNTLSFVFSALNYALPSQTCYRYRLVHGTDSTWHTVTPTSGESMIDDKGILHLSFVHLTPGHYELQVMASTRPYDWSGPANTIRFIIHAPWWKTLAAYSAYTLIVLLIIFTIFYTYYKISRQRMTQRHKEEILLLRIRNLIERCDEYEKQAVCETTVNEKKDNDTSPVLSDNDNAFLNKAVTLVEQHLNTPGYSVEQLSKDLCMERTGLYKKLTNLLDKSPSLFIRSIRLKRAADLLCEGELSISEIAEQVGFSSASYLSKCFFEEYGCKPSEYARQQKNKP